MRATSFLFLTILLLLGTVSHGQMNYIMEKTTGTYTPITGGKNFKYRSNPAFLDDNYSLATPIGFSFNYNDAVYDTFQVSTNGFIRMGSGLNDAGKANTLNSLVRRLIAPLWDDIQAVDTNSIQYLTNGTAPNRVLTIDFRTVKWTTATGNSSFMIKLYETTNIIEFIYGTINPGTSVSYTIGMSSNQLVSSSGSATGTNSFLSVNIGADAQNPSYMQTMSFSYNNLSKLPSTGTLLRFTQNNTPIAQGTYTVGATGDFKSISDMAVALNARGVSGPVTFLIQNGTYDDFLHLSLITGTSQTNTVTIKPAPGATVTLSPTNGSFSTNQIGPTAGENIVRLAGVSWVTLDGLQLVQNALNRSDTTRFENGLCVTSSYLSISSVLYNTGSKFNTIRNISIDMNAESFPSTYLTTTGIVLAGLGNSTSDSTVACSYNTFENFSVKDFGSTGFYMNGANEVAPDVGNKLTATSGRNFVGDMSISMTSGAHGLTGILAYKQKNLTIENTDVANIIVSSFGGASTAGITLNPIDAFSTANQGNILLRNNRVYNVKQSPIETSPSGTSGITSGIVVNIMNSGSTVTITGNEVFNLESNMPGANTKVAGIICKAGAYSGITPVSITNNVVSDLKAPISVSSSLYIYGIEVTSQASAHSNATVANNTVYLNEIPTSNSTVIYSTCLAIGELGTGKIDLRNNIFVNNLGLGSSGSGVASVLRADNTSNFSKISAGTNYNLYHYTNPGPNKGVSNVAGTIYKTLKEHILYLFNATKSGTRDYNSIFATVPFVNSATIPFDLRISTTSPAQASNAGVPVAGVTTDLDGNPRSLTTPDLGAFEFTGIDDDKTSPYILYDSLPSRLAGGNPLKFKAIIKDRNGVAAAGNTPRVYFKTKQGSSFVTQPGVFGTSDTVSFTVDPALANASANDTLQIYVGAQDNAPTPNGGTFPYGGNSTNPPGVSPAQAFFEVIVLGSPLSGDYTVGSGGAFSTLQEAFNAYNTRGIVADVNFILIDTGYVLPGTVGIQSFTQYGPNENARLRIFPGTGVNTTIWGSTDNALIIIYDPFVEFNGSNSPGASTRNLSIRNLGGTAGSGGIATSGRGQVIKNINFACRDSSVGFGVTLSMTELTEVKNNYIISAYKGITVINDCDSVTISGNIIGSTTPGSRIGLEGISLRPTTNFKITGNKIFGIHSNSTSAVAGITFFSPTAGTSPLNGLIDGNQIYSLRHTGVNSSARAVSGIYLAPNNPLAQITVTNNVISDILSGSGSGLTNGTRGIHVENGGGVNIVNNSVRLSGTITYSETGAAYSACISFMNATSVTNTVMNNILSNKINNPNGTNGTHFGVWAADSGNFSNFDFNLFDVSPSSGKLLNLGSTFINNRDSIFILTGKGDYSYTGQPVFADTLTLEINTQDPEAANTDGFGYPLGVTTDFLGNPRSTTVAGGPVDLGAYEYNLDVEPPLVYPNPPPEPGGLSSYVLNGIVIAQIQWGTTGTLPSNMALAYYGEDPQQTEDINYYFGKWKLVATGGSGYNYTFLTRLFPNAVGATDTNSLKAVVFTDKWYLTGTSSKIPGYISTSGLTAGGLYGLVDARFVAPVPVSPADNQLVDTNVTLSWSKANFQIPVFESGNDDGGAPTTYNIQLSSDQSFSAPVNYSTTDTFFTLSGLPDGTARYWRVGVTETNFFSGYSSPFTMYVRINRPTNLSAVSTQYNKVTLTWNDNSSSEIEVVLERDAGSSVFSVLAKLPANTVAFMDTTVTGNTSYRYRVKMVNQFSASNYSDPVLVVTLVPVELVSFSADFNGRNVILNWETATETNNRGYEVERMMGKEWQTAGFVKGAGTVTKLTPYTFSDDLRFMNFTGAVKYRLKQIDNDGTVAYSPEVSVEVDLTPKEYALYQNYPNPFNPSTVIKYALPAASRVSVKVYNLAGEMVSEIFNGSASAGYHDIVFSASGLASGVYFYVIDATAETGGKNFREVKKMVVMK